MIIRTMKESEKEQVLDLVWRVFQKYEAPEYSDEGIKEFYDSIHSEEFLGKLRFYLAFVEDKLAGVIATRNEGGHIALLFVEEQFQGHGIGKSLIEKVISECSKEKLTVNSSPYAIDMYGHMGFVAQSEEQVVNELRFTPMVFHL